MIGGGLEIGFRKFSLIIVDFRRCSQILFNRSAHSAGPG